MSGSTTSRSLQAMARLWWMRLPLASQRISASLGTSLVDGHFLNAFPGAASVLPYLIFVGALVIGSGSIGFSYVFTESFPLLVCLALLGSISASLGAAFVAGFALGDFFIAHTVWQPTFLGEGVLSSGLLAGLIRLRVPLLIEYALMAGLAVAIPLVARAILSDLRSVRHLPPGWTFVLVGVLNVVTAFFLTLLWTNAAPLMIRPAFTWSWPLGVPPAQAITPLQMRGDWIVRASVIGVIARLWLLWLIYQTERLRGRLPPVERGILGRPLPYPWIDRLPTVVRAALGASVTVLLLAGIIDRWWVALMMFVALFIGKLLLSAATPQWIDPWRRLTSRVPTVVRLAGIVGFTALAGSLLVETQLQGDSYAGLALILLIPILMVYLLFPGTSAPREAAR